MKTAEEIVREKGQPMVTIDADQTVQQAIEILARHRIGAVLVTRGGAIVGIWTERDLVRDMAQPGFDPRERRLGGCMTSPVPSAPGETPLVRLEEMFLGLFVRHLLVEKEGTHLGLLSIGDVMRASLLAKDDQIKQLNSIASWEYYEDWGWDRKRARKG
jgi:CBS domain-containing protein